MIMILFNMCVKKKLHGCGRNREIVSSGKLVCVLLFTIGVF
jgi:hypothetical protein